MNLVEFLETQVKNDLDKPAIIEDGQEISYRDLWQRVDRLAKAFLDLGIKQGDRIAICLPNCQEYIYSFFASLKINAIAVPLKQTIASYELKTILKDCQPSLFISDNVFLKRMLPFDPSIETGRLAVCSRQLIRAAAAKRTIRLEDLFKNNSGLGTTFSADDDTVATINYTYRGYGYPLGAMLTHGNYRYGTQTYVFTTGISLTQKLFLVLSMFHVYPFVGCILAPFSVGASVVITKEVSIKRNLNLINCFKVNILTATPTFYWEVLKIFMRRKYIFSSIQLSLSGGSLLELPVYFTIKEKIGWDICQGYGLTECLPVTCNPVIGNKPETLGKVGQGTMIKVMDEQGKEKKVGKTGEIVVGGPTVMKGYYNKKKETEAVLKQGWCWTGDYGYFDQQGYLYFTGLKKQIAKVGGNTVDLIEVKRTLCFFPGVISARINTLSDELWGQILSAEVLVHNPQEFKLNQLRSFLRHRLSSYKIPQLKIAGA